jgi:DNA-binding XRE family transcriptional regulator
VTLPNGDYVLIAPPCAAEFKGNVPVLQTEAWQGLKAAKHEQLIKSGLVKIEPRWGRAGEREGVLRAPLGLSCGMPLNAIIQILAAALAWAALCTGLFFLCIPFFCSDAPRVALRSGVMVPIVPVQCWLAREALGWTAPDLARAADVSPPTVRRFERGGEVRANLIESIQRALKKAGVIFIDANDGGPGVRLRKG